VHFAIWYAAVSAKSLVNCCQRGVCFRDFFLAQRAAAQSKAAPTPRVSPLRRGCSLFEFALEQIATDRDRVRPGRRWIQLPSRAEILRALLRIASSPAG
jgi:hypothetical protein